MTSKFKCPFCGDNLRLHEDCIWGVFACSHPTCEKSANMYGTKELWAALIQSQQDLEESQQATLENAQTVLEIHKDLETAKADIEDYKKYKALWEQIRNNTILELESKLEIARQALKKIDTTRCIPQQTLISLGKFSKTTRFNAGNIICVATPDQIHNTLEQINRKED